MMPFYSTVFQLASSIVDCFILFPASVISTVTYIEPSHVGVRTAVLVFGISQALRLRGLPHVITRSRAINGILAQFLWVYVMRSFDLLLLRRAYFPAKDGEVKASSTLPKEQDAVGRANEKAQQTLRTSGTARFLQSFYLFFTLRDIGTSHTFKIIPPFSASDPTWVPSRTAFLVRHTIIAVVGYLVADIPSITPSIDPKVAAQMNLPIFSRLFDIGIEEAITRLILTTSSWVFGLATLSSFHSSLAVLFVGFGLSEPRFWPPQFGALEDSTSLRGWWGKTWHQTLRKQVESSAGFLSEHILRLQDKNIVSRYVKLMLSFAFSGLLHHAASGLTPWRESRAMSYFILQGLGIMAEDVLRTGSKLEMGRLLQ